MDGARARLLTPGQRGYQKACKLKLSPLRFSKLSRLTTDNGEEFRQGLYSDQSESRLKDSSQMPPLAVPTLGTGLLSVLIGFLVVFIIYLLVIGFVLWLAGEIVVGRRVTFGEALGVAAVGTFLVGGVIFFIGGLLGVLLGLLIFLLLVKHYFRTGWLGAMGVGIMAIIVGVVIAFIFGIALIAFISPPKIP